MNYPNVLSEEKTLALLHEGRSIARYGDGELRVALGGNCVSQKADPLLAKELRRILMEPGECLVGIPNVKSATPKAANWRAYGLPPYLGLYNASIPYGSSFITRPDSAPWIDTPAYWHRVRDLWADRDVVLVKGTERSLRIDMMPEAKSVTVVSAPARDAYFVIDELFDALKKEKRRVILCIGCAATVLAWRLANAGVNALDLGHVGMTMRRAGQYQSAKQPVTFDTFKFKISDEAAPYLSVQRLGMEAFAARALWEGAYNSAMFEAFEAMTPFLPAECKTVLDIGSGLGGIDALLNRHYGGGVTVAAVDGENDPPIAERHDKPFNSRDITTAFLSANGVRDIRYMTPQTLRPVAADLIISSGSWCFHYPPETYLEFVKSCCRPGTRLILEVRRQNAEWFETLAKHFQPIGTAGVFTKFERRVYTARV